MKRKLWKALLWIVLFVSFGMMAIGLVNQRNLQADKPLICVAASVYEDGTVIERPCPAEIGAADGLRMTLPTPGKLYRPEGWLP